MKNVNTIVALVLVAVLATGIFYAIVELGYVNYDPFGPGTANQEKVTISSAFTNGTANAVFVKVKVIETADPTGLTGHPTYDVNFNYAIIKDRNGTDIATTNLSIQLPKDESATLRVNCTLPSGNYTVLLETSEGGTFVSPTLTIK
jgi:hypothetical protein